MLSCHILHIILNVIGWQAAKTIIFVPPSSFHTLSSTPTSTSDLDLLFTHLETISQICRDTHSAYNAIIVVTLSSRRRTFLSISRLTRARRSRYTGGPDTIPAPRGRYHINPCTSSSQSHATRQLHHRVVVACHLLNSDVVANVNLFSPSSLRPKDLTSGLDNDKSTHQLQASFMRRSSTDGASICWILRVAGPQTAL